MTIKKDFTFRLRNNETEEITCEVFFKVVDSNRKAPIEVTGCIICEIKKWIKIYQEKIIPGLVKSKNKDYQKIQDCVNTWEYRLRGLIAENQPTTDQNYVTRNSKLLEPNQLIPYNQALFLLLGLNAIEFDYSLRALPTLDNTRPDCVIDVIFWESSQNQALKTSAFIKDGKITSENLKELAEANGFFRVPLKNRDIPNDISKKLHEALLDDRFITGKFNDLWVWLSARNQLTYLAKKLKQNRILGDDCHKELSNYIQDPSPTSKKPLKNIKTPSNTNAIDTIVNELTR